MDRTRVSEWVQAYERAWRTPGTEAALALFTPDATYLQAPYREPVVGAGDIADMWEAERNTADEVFSMASEVVAVDGDTAVVRVSVDYGDPVEQEFLDLWVMRFAPDGRCRAFEEWPFWPDREATS
jgi:ketosteroid isomerase-like protein